MVKCVLRPLCILIVLVIRGSSSATSTMTMTETMTPTMTATMTSTMTMTPTSGNSSTTPGNDAVVQYISLLFTMGFAILAYKLK